MTQNDVPVQMPAEKVTETWSVLPSWLPVPGLGTLPVNAFLRKGAEPMLVDTGLAALSDRFIETLFSEVDPGDLRWIWLSHTDADHVGNLATILAKAPKAQVVTNFLGAGKLSLLGFDTPERLRILQPGEDFELGADRVHQVRPPYYDAPETMGFLDPGERIPFAADAFGALLTERVGGIEEIGAEALRDGLVGWSSVDAPWLAALDRTTLGAILNGLDALAPAHVLSGHLPPARRLDILTRTLRKAYGQGTTGAIPPETAAQLEAALG